MELRQYFSILLKWWWLLVASVLVAGLSSYFATKATPNTYVSHTTIIVGQVLQNPNANSSDIYNVQALAQSYSDLAYREPVLHGALTSVGLTWDWSVLQGMVQSRVVAGTQLLEISVTDTDPQRAKVLADEIAHQLILQSPSATDPEKESERVFILSQISELKTSIKNSQDELVRLNDVISKATSARQIQEARNQQTSLGAQITTWQATYAALLTNLQKGTPNYLSVMEPAQLPARPVGPKLADNVLLAVVIGLVLSAGGAFLLEYIDDTLHSPDEARKELGLVVMGSIAGIKGTDYASKLIPVKQPRSPIAEAYRMLRTNLQYTDIDHPLHTLLVTSCAPMEGKSLTAANLAIVSAQSGKRVILVDADLRRPMQHQIFSLKGSIGLTTLLMDPKLHLDQVLQETGIENLQVLASGPIPPNPSEFIGSKKMGNVITELLENADLVIFDSPPTLVVSDAPVLSTSVDGVLLIVQAGRTRKAGARHAKEALVAVGAHLIGVVINRVSIRSTSYYRYYTAVDEYQTMSGQNVLADFVARVKSRFSGDKASTSSLGQEPVEPKADFSIKAH